MCTDLPQAFWTDLTVWRTAVWVRGVASMLCWSLALLEIRYRAGSGAMKKHYYA